jgi:hypothetical protein
MEFCYAKNNASQRQEAPVNAKNAGLDNSGHGMLIIPLWLTPSPQQPSKQRAEQADALS